MDKVGIISRRESATIWVCVDCIMHHANGECGGCREGHDEEPLNLLDPANTAMGMMRSEHRGENFCGDVDECDCETDTYSTSRCEGCGSWLHGERHAMTVWL